MAGDAHGRWPVERRAVGVERRPVHRLIACAARPGGVPAAVPEAGLMTDEHLSGAELCPFGQRAGGWVIHFPAVVCTSSPSTTTRLTEPTATGHKLARKPPQRRNHKWAIPQCPCQYGCR